MIGLIVVPILFAIKGIVVGVQKVKKKFGKNSESKDPIEDKSKDKRQSIPQRKQHTEWPIEENRIQRGAPNRSAL